MRHDFGVVMWTSLTTPKRMSLAPKSARVLHPAIRNAAPEENKNSRLFIGS